jgi:hypothetical protein
MLNCLGSDFVLSEDCIEERSVRGRCRENSDALLEKFSHLSDCGACRRGEHGNVVVQNDDRRAVLRNSDIAANDGEIPEIIQQAIWLYLRFTLSLRDVEDLLAERGIMVSYETVRRWVNHFGRYDRGGPAQTPAQATHDAAIARRHRRHRWCGARDAREFPDPWAGNPAWSKTMWGLACTR